MISLKELSEHFIVMSFDNGKTYILSDLHENGVISTNKYVGHIHKIKPGWYNSPNHEPTNKLDQLISDVKERYASFKYNSEFYDPSYRKGYFVELVISDWLDKHGFAWKEPWGDTCYYTCKRKNVYNLNRGSVTLSFSNLDTFGYEYDNANKKYTNRPELPETIDITLGTDTNDCAWVCVNDIPRNPESIISAI